MKGDFPIKVVQILQVVNLLFLMAKHHKNTINPKNLIKTLLKYANLIHLVIQSRNQSLHRDHHQNPRENPINLTKTISKTSCCSKTINITMNRQK